MHENPYRTSSYYDDVRTSTTSAYRAERPIGVTLLALLHTFGGMLMLGVQFVVFAKLGEIVGAMETVGIPPVVLVGGVMFLTAITIASGFGMWLGAEWGWWLTLFYYVYSVCRNLSALRIFVFLADELPPGGRGLEYYLFKHGVRIVICFLLIAYFCKPNVAEYFDVGHLNKAAAIGIVVLVCIAIVMLMQVLIMLW